MELFAVLVCQILHQTLKPYTVNTDFSASVLMAKKNTLKNVCLYCERAPHLAHLAGNFAGSRTSPTRLHGDVASLL